MFKVGDKFIVEVDGVNTPPENSGAVNLYRIKDLNYCLWAENSLVLPEKQLEKLAKVNDLKDEVKEAYKKGYAKTMEDIQTAVRVFRVMNNEDRKRHFDGKYTTAAILDTFDPREIVEKLKAYEKEQSKIKVGDEVKVENSGGYLGKAIVTYVDKYEKEIYVVFAGGSAGEITDGTRLRKTGRHFDEVESLLKILKNMTGGEDSDQIPF